MIKIVDSHQHLWDLKRFHLPWTATVPVLNRSFLPADYTTATAGLNVEKTIYMEVDLAPEQQLDEVNYVSELCANPNNPMVAAVAACRPGEAGFATYLNKIKNNPYLKGLRRILHGPDTPPGFCLQNAFIDDINRLAELGWRFDLCIRAAELNDAAKLIDACPEVAFILDHCGNADVRAGSGDQSLWRHGIDAVAERPNVVCKMSGFIFTVGQQAWSAETISPIVDHVLDCFGPDRVMFGGDWPVCTQGVTYAEWVNALKNVIRARPYHEQNKLFYDNAIHFYDLND